MAGIHHGDGVLHELHGQHRLQPFHRDGTRKKLNLPGYGQPSDLLFGMAT